jgi:TonB family protein
VTRQPSTFFALAIAAATFCAPHATCAASAAPGPVGDHPDWISRPTAEDVMNYRPAKGMAVDGHATISCVVTDRGTLDRCRVVSETPLGDGFGAAALAMSALFRMRPRTANGAPVGGAIVNIPIHFLADSAAARPSMDDTVAVYASLPWSATPTAADLNAAFPARAAGHVDDAKVVLRCRVTAAGRLEACMETTEQPGGYGFAGAARELAAMFRIADDQGVLKGAKDAYVDVPFDFRDPAKPIPPLELVDPEWRASTSPPTDEAFPHEALKDGLKTGVATVHCRVDHTGALTECTVVGEQPANEGFGRLALEVARRMTMNPWSKQGLPVDDAEIRLPIRFNLKDAPAAPAGKP